MSDSTIPRPGDTDNALLRKILTATNAGGGGGGGGGGGAVTIADGADVTEGSVSDAAVSNPLSSGSVIALLKGLLTTNAKSSIQTTTLSSLTSILGTLITTQTNTTNISTATGAVADAAVTNPASSASVIAALKGILTEELLVVTNTGSLSTNLGAVADAAVINPASSASVIALLKGVLTEVLKIPASPSTDRTTAAAPFSVELSDGAAFYTGAKDSSITTVNTNLGTLNTSVVANQNVGGYTVSLKDTTAVSTTPAYTAGDAVGAKRTIAGALRTSNGSGILESITILDRANQKAAMELFIFDSNPAAATITDNAAFVFSTDDLKVLAHVTIAATDYITVNSKAVATIKGLGITLKGADASTSLYAALVAVGTPTYAATTDLQLIYGILQD